MKWTSNENPHSNPNVAHNLFTQLIGCNQTIEVLIDEVEGNPVRYLNSAVIASNGTIYFTDSSSRFAPVDWGRTFEATLLDIVE